MEKSAVNRTENHYKNIKTINIIGYLCLIIWPAFLFASFMSFDAPGSEEHIVPYVIVALALSQPLQIIIFPIISRKLIKKQKIRTAYAFSIFPIVPFALLIILPLIIGKVFDLIHIFT
ncbi:MAG: hypothetical protein GWP12_02555 [Nitrospirae bacterium]|nr:hypothetical protein [Nitrospirota bacterium]